MHADDAVRQDTKEEFLRHDPLGKEKDEVLAAMRAVYADTGYDLGDIEGRLLAEQKRDDVDAPSECTTDGSGVIVIGDVECAVAHDETDCGHTAPIAVPVVRETTEWKGAHVIPRFVAACALMLRSELGSMAPTEANILLAQRKYLKLCRERRVRHVDVVAHQQHVINALFTEGVLDDVALVRRRLPRWVQWLRNQKSVTTLGPVVC